MRDSGGDDWNGDRVSRMRLPGGPDHDRPKYPGGKVTAGVPLARFIKPRLQVTPEIVVRSRPSSSDAHRFRQLCATLDDLGSSAARTIVVTSSGDGEGKSTVALNLALALAGRSGNRVLLLEGDLRRPSLGRRITPPPQVGLAELLAGHTDLTHVLLELAGCPLHVLPAGRPPAEPGRLLVSEALADLMAYLTEQYTRIVIDTPPIVPYTDADLLARFGDGALVVARAGLTRRGQLLQAIASVRSVPVLGVLLNDTTLAAAD